MESSGVRMVVMIRDPRDVVVSEVFYATSRPNHPFHERFISQPDMAARIRAAVEGSGVFASVRRRLEEMSGWLDHAGLVLRFEDLIGPQGGGDMDRQRRALGELVAYLGLPAGQDWVLSTMARAFSNRSPTFRKGAIGEWRRYFDDEATELFDRSAGDMLKRFGYD